MTVFCPKCKKWCNVGISTMIKCSVCGNDKDLIVKWY